MNSSDGPGLQQQTPEDATPDLSLDERPNQDSGLLAVVGISAFFRIPTTAGYLHRELALGTRAAAPRDLMRALRMMGLKSRTVGPLSLKRILRMPKPAIVQLNDGTFGILTSSPQPDLLNLIDPVKRSVRQVAANDLQPLLSGTAILVARRFLDTRGSPEKLGFVWFWPSLWKYRHPVFHVFLASLIIQIFALITPLFFQVVIDKVLAHRSYSTLMVIAVGIVGISLFELVLQYLRHYVLSHTTNRLDVELGQRLFAHLIRLPISYFETRPTGQTVARLREIETIREFLTGQGLTAILDAIFAMIFIAVLFMYSETLALIVVLTIPIYFLIATVIRPPLKTLIEDKFSKAAANQQMLVESVVGIQTIKAAAVEPVMRAEWEERLAAYVRSGFNAGILGMKGQIAIQAVDKGSRALLLFFGAHAVIDGQMSVGALVAFNMISGQVAAPILRLSQLWQDVQQIQISLARLGDILNAPTEPMNTAIAGLPPPRGEISLKGIRFRYSPTGQDILKGVTLTVRPGEVIGFIGPSGSGKSSLTKLVQRLYLPTEGQVLVDGIDIAHVDPAWLRRHIGVVLQENLLFNRSIHENIALAQPALTRSTVIHYAKLAGADEFVAKLPEGYDTVVEERGANLSGGQRQRLAIARALATNPRILILDEATSALDYESERIIQHNMQKISVGRTVIIVAHRLAAVRHCHRIVGMTDGRVVEIGTPQELLARPESLYARMVALQSTAA